MKEKAVVIVSGGMDSATLLYGALDQAKGDVLALSFDYGQRHGKELRYAERLCRKRGVQWWLIRLGDVTSLLKGSALTDSQVDVPLGHYAEQTMAQTVVPNRNAMMLSIAYAVAIGQQASFVLFGAHAGDHAIYPDCRHEFVDALNTALTLGNVGMTPVLPIIRAPFLYWTKTQIVTQGELFKVPWAETWSCYQGDPVHCGKCGTCVERRQAFRQAGVEDPTIYAVPWEQTEVLIKAYEEAAR